MKRLALLAATAFMAMVISACGESAEKKAETGAPSPAQQQSTGTGAPGTETNQSGQ